MHRPVFVLLVAAWALCAAPTAEARTCSSEVIQARGDPSRFEALAKAKARGNWRARVRSLPALGADYSNWSRADDAHYRCAPSGGAYRCVAIARPCKD